jgi:signal transduction histidine kinase
MTGGGKITVLAKKLENGKIVISIADQGVGIKEGNIEKVFDPLFTDKEEGVGLGLSLCRDIVTRHGGKISAANNSKLGITIEIELPSQQGISEMNKHKKDVAT